MPHIYIYIYVLYIHYGESTDFKVSVGSRAEHLEESSEQQRRASGAQQQRRNASLAGKHTQATKLGDTNARNPSISTPDILVPKLRYSSTRLHLQRSSQDAYLIRPHNAGSKLCVSDGVSA